MIWLDATAWQSLAPGVYDLHRLKHPGEQGMSTHRRQAIS
jgi:hypothetical protein